VSKNHPRLFAPTLTSSDAVIALAMASKLPYDFTLAGVPRQKPGGYGEPKYTFKFVKER